MVGLIVLALGLTLNTKTSLGASAIISVPYTLSVIYHLDLGNTTLLMYFLFVIIQILLKKDSLIKTILQIPLSILFTRFMNLFKEVITYSSENIYMNIVICFIAVFFTALGIFLTVNADLVPNPGDGIVSTIADCLDIELGRTKNIFDISCVIVSVLIGSLNRQPLIGVGIGTVISMLFVGRFLSVINWFAKTLIFKKNGLRV